MKRKVKIFVIYFPVILLFGQVMANLLYFVSPDLYYKTGFYLNTFFGTNVLFALFLLAFTFLFDFCTISRAAAITQCLFAVIYLIIKEDNLYNILFQIIAGTSVLIGTFWQYIKKFPYCQISLVIGFLSSAISEGSCSKGYDKWHNNLYHNLSSKYHETNTA